MQQSIESLTYGNFRSLQAIRNELAMFETRIPGKAIFGTVVIAVFLSLCWFAFGYKVSGLGEQTLVSRVKDLSANDWAATLSNSLSLSSILILTALGLAITFGVMRVINMAHGEFLMLGAYTAFVVGQVMNQVPGWLANLTPDGEAPGFWVQVFSEWAPNSALYVAIPVSFLVVGLIGYFVEVCLIRFLYGRPLDTLLATWGVGLILQQAILRNFGTDLKPMHLPTVMQGHVTLGALAIPNYRIFLLTTTCFCLLAVYLWFYRTSFGLKIRAVVQNRQMAAALGISTRKVDSLTFAFASGLAGVAGCMLGHLYTVKVDMGASYIVEAFMVVILGGMGNMAGSVAGGGLIGTGDSVVEKIIGSTPIANVIILFVVVIVILLRPSGLFASKERTYD
jgi:urea transport system permease protein